MLRSAILAFACFTPFFANADAFGTLNPEEGGPMRLSENLATHPDRAGTICWVVYEMQKGGARHQTHAFELMKSCAASGNAPSMILLAHAYENGLGTDISAEKATYWVRKAAEMGYSLGEYHYGVALLNGFGTEKNQNEAVKWLKKAADDGDAGALALLSTLNKS